MSWVHTLASHQEKKAVSTLPALVQTLAILNLTHGEDDTMCFEHIRSGRLPPRIMPPAVICPGLEFSLYGGPLTTGSLTGGASLLGQSRGAWADFQAVHTQSSAFSGLQPLQPST